MDWMTAPRACALTLADSPKRKTYEHKCKNRIAIVDEDGVVIRYKSLTQPKSTKSKTSTNSYSIYSSYSTNLTFVSDGHLNGDYVEPTLEEYLFGDEFDDR